MNNQFILQNGLQTLKKTLDSVRQEKVALEQQKRSVDKQCGEIRVCVYVAAQVLRV